MNSYPYELLAQHVPLMLVAGLTEDQQAQQPTTPLSEDATNSQATQHAHRPSVVSEARDSFAILMSRLRNVLGSRRRGAIWDADKSHRFHVLLVDKAYKLPPRKIAVTPPSQRTDEHYTPSTATPRSPLSPLTPTSPVYPDGLINPIWVRKHIELVPAVFVLFLRLWEPPPPASPLDVKESADHEEERKKDMELATEIGARKRSASERGIKLTVVLLASRRMLDDPSLDTRLSFIRRQSNLDTRAALFVLSPLSSAELGEFVQSLQEALFESAMEYYATHSKRVRRKKNRYPQQPSIITPGSGPSTGRPLRPEGWAVRYEYKLATFAEFRMEDELARKHYEDCWEGLSDMFSSTAILPPRTKRWAEAKVLADCVSFKICKLYLYQSEHARAMSHFNRHLHRFNSLSRGWGMGHETFEFWASVARQYRAFAELLEVGLKMGLTIPTAQPILSGSATPLHGGDPTASNGTMNPEFATALGVEKVGVNPTNILQHPGFYFYAAASCTQQRYNRFLEMTSHHENGTPASSPALINEGKIDHQGIILELYTKAYELFKVHGPSHGRLTFHMAYRIAESYYSAGKYDLAVKFFERIAKTYRREEWSSMLRPMISMWCESGRQLGDVEMTVKLLLDILASETSEADIVGIQEEIMGVLNSTSPSGPVVLDATQSSPLLKPLLTFWKPQVGIHERVSFQLALYPPSGGLAQIPFSSLKIQWDATCSPIEVEHSDSAENLLVDVGHLELSTASSDGDDSPVASSSSVVKANLRWKSSNPIIFTGSVASSTPMDFKITQVSLFVDMGHWNIEIPLPLEPSTLASAPPPSHARWLTSSALPPSYLTIYRDKPHSCFSQYGRHDVSVAFKHQEPAYLSERYPVIIEVTNNDDEDMIFVGEVLLQPAADDGINHIIINEQSSTGLIEGVEFGTVKPGASSSQTLYLISTGVPGERVIDVSVISRPASVSNDISRTNETLSTLVLHTIEPIRQTSEVTYTYTSGPLSPLLHPSSFDYEAFDKKTSAIVMTTLTSVGPWDLMIDSARLVTHATPNAKVTACSLDLTQPQFPCTWRHNDTFMIVSQVDIGNDDDPLDFPFPGTLEVTWRKSQPDFALTTTSFTLPRLQSREEGLVAILQCPSSAQLHQPFKMQLSVQNRQLGRTADITLDVDSSDAFVLSGPRHLRLPTLVPGTSEEITYNVFPLACGMVRLPTFRIHDRRRAVNAQQVQAPRASMESGADTKEDTPGTRVRVVLQGQEAVGGDEDGSMAYDSHTIVVYPS